MSKFKPFGWWWNEENYLPEKHVCNYMCRIEVLRHYVTKKELGV